MNLPVEDFRIETTVALNKLSETTNFLRAKARKKPDDKEAQLQAQTAIDFHSSQDGFPPLILHDEVVQKPSSSPSGSSSIRFHCHLPVEVLRLIIERVAEFDYRTQQETLVALAASCPTLRALAEPYLYSRPRHLEMIERQWGFRFTMLLEPHLGQFVKMLNVIWMASGENTKLLVDIARACSNTELHVQRGKGTGDSNLVNKETVLNMAALLEASSHVTTFTYATFTTWEQQEELRYSDGQREDVFRLCHEDPRFEGFATKLVDLGIHGDAQWLVEALTSHVGSSLKSLAIDLDVHAGVNYEILEELSLKSPYLEELTIEHHLYDGTDFVQACKRWGVTLHTLNISTLADTHEWIDQFMPSMSALQRLLMSRCWTLTAKNLESIAASLPHQQLTVIDIGRMGEPDGLGDPEVPATPEDIEEAIALRSNMSNTLAKLIRHHASTLEHVHLIDIGFRVGRVVLQSCREAKKLRGLFCAPSAELQPSDLDDLLEACPNLEELPEDLLGISERPREWYRRIEEQMDRVDQVNSKYPRTQGGLGRTGYFQNPTRRFLPSGSVRSLYDEYDLDSSDE